MGLVVLAWARTAASTGGVVLRIDRTAMSRVAVRACTMRGLGGDTGEWRCHGEPGRIDNPRGLCADRLQPDRDRRDYRRHLHWRPLQLNAQTAHAPRKLVPAAAENVRTCCGRLYRAPPTRRLSEIAC